MNARGSHPTLTKSMITFFAHWCAYEDFVLVPALGALGVVLMGK